MDDRTHGYRAWRHLCPLRLIIWQLTTTKRWRDFPQNIRRFFAGPSTSKSISAGSIGWFLQDANNLARTSRRAEGIRNELCDRLIRGFPGIESPADHHCETLQVIDAFAAVEQAFEEL